MSQQRKVTFLIPFEIPPYQFLMTMVVQSGVAVAWDGIANLTKSNSYVIDVDLTEISGCRSIETALAWARDFGVIVANY